MKKQLLVILAALIMTTSAQAKTYLDVQGGLAFPQGNNSSLLSSPSYNAAVEIVIGMENLQLGGFFQNYFYSLASPLSGTSSTQFYGGVARIGFVPTPIFADAKVGLESSTGSNVTVGFGVGLGWRFNLSPFTTLSPRVGYTFLPASYTGGTNSFSVIDTSLLLSIGF